MRKLKYAYTSLGYFTVKSEDTGRVIPYIRNNAQKLIWNTIKTFLDEEQKIRLVVIKGRQLGGSTDIDRLGLDFALMNDNFSFYIQAHTQADAVKLFRKNIRQVFEALPKSVKESYKTKLDNVSEIVIDGVREGNKYVPFNSEAKAGVSARSDQIDFLHVSEAGEIGKSQQKFNELVDGSMQAAEQGHIIVESTAKGKNAFYDWVQGIKDNPKWKILFLGWWLKPAYSTPAPNDDLWITDYKQLAEEYLLARNPQEKVGLTRNQFYWYYLKVKEQRDRIKQEYPLDVDEAFASSGISFFRKTLIEKAFKEVENVKPALVDGYARYYEAPNSNKAYFCGIDTANEGQDNYSMDIIDASGKQVFQMAGTFKSIDDDGTKEKSPITNFTREALKVLKRYNAPFLTIETNGTGSAIQRDIVSANYPPDKIYRRSIKDKKNLNFGWHTGKDTRVTMLSDLRASFENGKLKILDKNTLNEFDTFVEIDGKWQAESGKHDDRVFSLALAVQSYLFATTTI
jgi:hypothetical protein